MKLKVWLAYNDMTQKQFADLVGTTPAVVTHWVRGQHYPRPRFLEKIAEVTDGKVLPKDMISE